MSISFIGLVRDSVPGGVCAVPGVGVVKFSGIQEEANIRNLLIRSYLVYSKECKSVVLLAGKVIP